MQEPAIPIEELTTAAEVERLVADARAAGRIALDTEFLWERTYAPVPCLVQVATADRIAILDPIAGVDVKSDDPVASLTDRELEIYRSIGQGETPADLAMIEQTMSYSGMYFVLMGRLSPLDGVGPRDIGLDRLLERAGGGEVQEVILATNFTNEGEATAHYVAEMLRARKLRVSRIARGVPLGGELEYVDAGTISQALLERREI